MQSETQKKKANKVSWLCYPFLSFGLVQSQASLVFFGLLILWAVFRDHPNTGYYIIGVVSLAPVFILGIGLAAGGIYAAYRDLKVIGNGEIVSAKLLIVDEDRSSDEIEYRMRFEYHDGEGKAHAFATVRASNDLSIGQSFPAVVNVQRGTALIEPNLPCGITVANLYGVETIDRKSWIRIGFIPLLSLIPLLGFNESVSALVKTAATKTGQLVYWWTVLLQMIWLLSNRRYFPLGKVIVLNEECGSQ